MSLILFLDLCIDAPLPGSLVQLPLGHLEEVGGLPEAHLPAADHLDGVLERLVLREFGTVDRDPLVLEAGFWMHSYNYNGQVGIEARIEKEENLQRKDALKVTSSMVGASTAATLLIKQNPRLQMIN